MESLKNQGAYDKYKKIVKQWEQNFMKSYGRPPSKLDIREADKNVRSAYCMYFKLKTAALEESLMGDLNDDIDFSTENNGLDSVPNPEENLQTDIIVTEEKSSDKIWGEHLNKHVETEVIKSSTKKENMNSSFTKKLFANSKFIKRNPRKSFTASRNNSSSNLILSQPTTSNNTENDDFLSNFNSTLPLKSGNIFPRSQSVNVISHLLNNDNTLVRKIDTGWLQRVAETTGTELPEVTNNLSDNVINNTRVNSSNNELDSDDIISGSDDETSNSFHLAKKIKLSPIKNNTTLNINVSEKLFESSKPEAKHVQMISVANTTEDPLKENIEIDQSKIETQDKSKDVEKDEFIPNTIESSDSEYEKPKKRKRKVKTSNKTKKSVNRKTPKKTETIESTNKNNDTEDYEMEYSIKPPPSTVPRFKNIRINNIEDNTEQKTSEPTKQNALKNKLLKKIESGTLNENFVRLDIKKKVYVRGKKHMNFTKYKKQLWKNKKKSLYGPDMDMGGCDGGELTCFKCGKTGHFSRQCKSKIVDQLLPLNAVDEEECLLPSLQEASQMARDSVLAVRIPNLISQSSSQSEIMNVQNNESESESKTFECDFNDDEDLEKFMLHTEVVNIEDQTTEDFNQKLSQISEERVGKPIYKLNEDGSLPETPKEVFEALRLFGHKSFRPGQEQAVMRILCGQSTLVTLSTGSGKSLCYQLPAYIYAQKKNCISLVISPLVSLMEDQVSGIPSFLNVACLHTLQTATQKEKVLKLIDSGELNILLVSPEAVTSGEKKSGFGSIFKKLPPIAFACIDEAHCVSQWSHNFRPSYLVICRVLRERLGIKTVLGLTATSTYATSNSIVHHLQIPDGHNGVISDIPIPDNLFLSVSNDQQKDPALKNLLISDPYNEFDSIIIYCTRREECERIASYLRTSIKAQCKKSPVKRYKSLSTVAEPYHAGLPASKRRTVQNAFMNGYLRIVVATVAFGMGINKADIRGVIHYNMPKNFESYVQEVGRAGRDGLPAHCHLFLDSEGRDQNELRRHIYANSMDRYAIRKLLQKIFIPCDCKQICPRHEVAFSIEETVKLLDVPEENISTLLCYLELHEKRYIEVLTPVYTMCKIISYGTLNNIVKAAKECPPLAMALAILKKENKELEKNVFEFPVIDIAAAMGWDSGIVKSKLKNLEWIVENNAPKRSTLTVEFSNLGFHVRSPGNLSATELDDALDSLFAKKNEQETTSLKQLQVVHSTLTKVSERYHHLCYTENYISKYKDLKTKIREYFQCEQPLEEIDIENTCVCNEEQIAADARSLMAMYRDNSFTGRAIARIFHGIQSPNYPAVIWGRCKFWRLHLNADFTKVMMDYNFFPRSSVKPEVNSSDSCSTSSLSSRDQLPEWVNEFTKECIKICGTRCSEKLDELMESYIKEIKQEIIHCSSSPNRAAFIVARMNKCLIFFYLYYSDIKEFFVISQWNDNIVELLAMYCQLELKASFRMSRKDPDSVMCSKIMNMLCIYLNYNYDAMIHVILKIPNYGRKHKDIFDPIFRKLLLNKKPKPLTELEYIRNLLAFKLWKRLYCKEDKKIISQLALTELRPPRSFFTSYRKYKFLPPCNRNTDIHSQFVTGLVDLDKAIKEYFDLVDLKNKKSDYHHAEKKSFMSEFCESFPGLDNVGDELTDNYMTDKIKPENDVQEIEDDDCIIVLDSPVPTPPLPPPIIISDSPEVIDLTKDEPESHVNLENFVEVPLWCKELIEQSVESEKVSISISDPVIEEVKTKKIEELPLVEEKIVVEDNSEGLTEITSTSHPVEDTSVDIIDSSISKTVESFTDQSEKEVCSSENFEHVDSTSNINEEECETDTEDPTIKTFVVENTVEDGVVCSEIVSEVLNKPETNSDNVSDKTATTISNTEFEEFASSQNEVLLSQEPEKNIADTSLAVCDSELTSEVLNEESEIDVVTNDNNTEQILDKDDSGEVDDLVSPAIEPLSGKDYSNYLASLGSNMLKETEYSESASDDMTVNRKRKTEERAVRTYTKRTPKPEVIPESLAPIASETKLDQKERRVPLNGEKIFRFANGLWENIYTDTLNLSQKEYRLFMPNVMLRKENPKYWVSDYDKYDAELEELRASLLKSPVYDSKYDPQQYLISTNNSKQILERQDVLKPSKGEENPRVRVITRPRAENGEPTTSKEQKSEVVITKKRGSRKQNSSEKVKKRKVGRRKATSTPVDNSSAPTPVEHNPETTPWRFSVS